MEHCDSITVEPVVHTCCTRPVRLCHGIPVLQCMIVLMLSAGFAKDQRRLEEIIGELEKQGVKP